MSDGKFKPGQSGNPKGRPKGLLDRRQRLSHAMLAEADAVVSVVMEAAKGGDMTAASLVLSRVAPALRLVTPTVEFDFDARAPLSNQVEQVLQGIADGKVAPDIGKQIIESIAHLGSVRQVDELEARLKALEQHLS